MENELLNEMPKILNDNSTLSKEEKKSLKNEAKEKEESQPINTKEYIKEELTKEQKLSNFFGKIDFLSFENKEKEELALDIKSKSS